MLSVYFCPLHDCQEKVLDALDSAEYSVKILAFTFTDDFVAEKLYALSQKGVDVEVIYEKTRITRYSTSHFLEEVGISVFVDGNKYTMHEKMILIDDDTLILGSYNPTKSATTKNDENLLIIEDKILFEDAYNEYLRVRGNAVLP